MNEIEKNNQIIEARAEQLAKRIEALVVEARRKIASTANVVMVYTYFEIGRYVVEDEQGGEVRAEYGKGVLKGVSQRLTQRLGKGWSVENLTSMRKFYVLYSKNVTSGYEIQETEIQTGGVGIQDENRNQWLRNHQFVLPWTHYLILTHVSNPEARSFYEIEAFKQQWSKRQLQRQIGSGLYERLALSRDKDEVMRLATEGHVVEKPADIIKDPLVLEFCGLKPEASYSETDLESAIISRLQDFFCERKNDALVELTLPKDANIYAQQYALCLPDKALLQQKLREWIAEFKGKEDVE